MQVSKGADIKQILLVFFVFILASCSDIASKENFKIYRDDTRNVIIDNEINLMWQVSKEPVKSDFKGAHRYCDELNLAGFTDWRLPDMTELERFVLGYINGAFSDINLQLATAQDSGYWTRQMSVDSAANVWIVTAKEARIKESMPTSQLHVRCVR